jgi:hypothetical protein
MCSSPTLFYGSAPSEYHRLRGLNKQFKIAIFRPKGWSLLPQRPGWTDNILKYFSGLQKIEQRAEMPIELRGELPNKSRVWSL